MITELILEAFLALLDLFQALLPDWSDPCEDECTAAAEWLGGQAGFLDGLVPIHETAGYMKYLLAFFVIPIFIPYVIAKWIVGHFPAMGGD